MKKKSTSKKLATERVYEVLSATKTILLSSLLLASSAALCWGSIKAVELVCP
ncbi:hypothetical protein [Nibribacter koreensis]|uniref:hypothetical protein n=1 Tax=Nibribacter koreensis TaxID=1084519 RepID=UPI0031EB5277